MRSRPTECRQAPSRIVASADRRPRAGAFRQRVLDGPHSGKRGRRPLTRSQRVWADELPELVVQPFDLEGVVRVEHDPGALQR